MERQVIFRDYQEQTAADHNNLQAFTRESFDRIVKDAITAGRKYAGFNVSQTGQVEVQIAPGALYVEGAVHEKRSALTQSLATYTAAAAQRIVTLSAFGQETEVDSQQRDFLVDTETGETEPKAVAMTRSRDVNLVFTSGAESADPVPPPIPSTHVVIAHILMDTTQIVSITMVGSNEVVSTDDLDLRTGELEGFREAIAPRVETLASDLARLSQELQSRGSQDYIIQLYKDMARVKEQLEMGDEATDYGADRFLTPDESDVANAANLGFDAKVEEGIRFADANADIFGINLFSANDPNAKLVNGILMPKYSHALKLRTGTYHSDTGMAQYGFQTFDMVQKTMSRKRIRYGNWFTVCTNSAWWDSGKYDKASGIFKRGNEEFQVSGVVGNFQWPGHEIMRIRQIFVDKVKEKYWDKVVTKTQITGAQVAQTFLIANDTWATQLGFYITAKGGSSNISVKICEVTGGMPDITKVILHTTYAHTKIVTGWNRLEIPPTFLEGGNRYAVVLTSNANHKVGMSQESKSTLDGTFFYSTDGAYYQGDLTKDMMIEVWGAQFASSQVTIELEALNLDGGIRDIDINADMIEPGSAKVIFEVQPNGSGKWYQIDPEAESYDAFTANPPLCRFRVRFVGTTAMHGGITLTGSTVKVFRPKTAFRHVTTPIVLSGPRNTVTVQLVVEDFNDVAHDIACKLRVGSTDEMPDSTVVKVLDEHAGRQEITYTFNLAAPATTFRIVTDGATNSPTTTFHVSWRVHWAM